MRPRLALVLSLFGVPASGCWLAHDPGGHPSADGDADSDADSDTDADADADADGDGDAPPVPNPIRPAQVCGMRGLSNVTGGTLRLMVLDCAWIDGCTAVITDRTLDLRPTNGAVDRYPGDGSAGACAPTTWTDCEVPAGDYDHLSVWGEDLGVPCFGGDMDDCEAPDCVQPPREPLPEGCDIRTLPAEQVCGPSEVQSWSANDYSVVNTCGCPSDWRPAGCLVSEREGGLVFEARVASCSRCGDEDVCVSQDSVCSVYDPPPDVQQVSLEFRSGSEPIAFDVTVGGWGPVVCQP